nr:PREDICTED: melanin-concentrating hormone receptor 2 [Latimeria chalumnae]|eukprot:XP_014343474.1 PREDICTED: melanin-concentrating hormone receptor 2 [Latimeria chalumnae]
MTTEAVKRTLHHVCQQKKQSLDCDKLQQEYTAPRRLHISEEYTVVPGLKVTVAQNCSFPIMTKLNDKSFYRYLALVHPFHLTTLRTRSKIIQVNVCLWAASCIFVLPVWIYSKVIRFKDGLESCAIDITSANDVLWYTLYLTITSFFLPLPLILVFYILILCYAWEIHQKNKKASRYNAAILRDRMRRLTKIVLVFIGVSMVSVAPYHVIQLVSLQISHPTVTYYVCYYISICLSYFSSSINPFLYIFLSGSFRKRLTGCTMINVLMAEREINNVFFVFFSGHPLKGVANQKVGVGPSEASIAHPVHPASPRELPADEPLLISTAIYQSASCGRASSKGVVNMTVTSITINNYSKAYGIPVAIENNLT